MVYLLFAFWKFSDWFPQWLPVCSPSNNECSHVLTSIYCRLFSWHCQCFLQPHIQLHYHTWAHNLRFKKFWYSPWEALHSRVTHGRWNYTRLLRKRSYLKLATWFSHNFPFRVFSTWRMWVAETSIVKPWQRRSTEYKLIFWLKTLPSRHLGSVSPNWLLVQIKLWAWPHSRLPQGHSRSGSWLWGRWLFQHLSQTCFSSQPT